MTTVKIREKIQNLLALAANNTNSNEAISAMCKARELMLKYNITLSEEELNPKDTSTVKNCFTKFTKLKLQRHHLQMGVIVAKNFRCKTYYSGTKVHFMGLGEDAVAAMNIFSFLVGHLEEMFKVFLAADKKANPVKYAGKGAAFSKAVKRNWIDGFNNGLYRAFEEQNRADESYNLMVVIPNAVMVEYEALNTVPSTMKGHQGRDLVDNAAWNDGFTTGKNSLNHNSIEGRPLPIEG